MTIYPTLSPATGSASAIAANSHPVNVPAVAAGDGVITAIRAPGAGSITPPAGVVYDVLVQDSEDFIGKRIAASAAPAGVESFTTANPVTAAAQVRKVAAASWSQDPAGIIIGPMAFSITANRNPDPPATAAPWGDAPKAYLAYCSMRDDDETAIDAPEYYQDLAAQISGGGDNNGCSNASAWRQTIADSQDPASFFLDANARWRAWVIAVQGIAGQGAQVERAIYELLQQSSDLTDLVGQRVYDWDEAPQNPVYPYVTFPLVSTLTYPTYGATTGVRRQRFQFDCWARGAFTAGGDVGAIEVSAAVRRALGRKIDQVVAGVRFQDILEERLADPEPDLKTGPDSEGLGRRSQDYFIFWESV